MTLLGNANWWAPRFLRHRSAQPAVPEAGIVTPPELVSSGRR
jgi:hypothetical protein